MSECFCDKLIIGDQCFNCKTNLTLTFPDHVGITFLRKAYNQIISQKSPPDDQASVLDHVGGQLEGHELPLPALPLHLRRRALLLPPQRWQVSQANKTSKPHSCH